MLFKKQELNSLDFTGTEGMNVEGWETWAESVQLSHLHGWLLPQLVAYFGTWKLQYTTSGEVDGLATVLFNTPDPKQKAFYILSRIKRSLLVPIMTKAPDYGTLTPLVLMGFKRMQGIPYETFRNCVGLQYLLEPRLCAAVVLGSSDLETCGSLGSDRLLEIQKQGLTTKTGKTAGSIKPARSTWSLSGIQDTELGHLPKLTQTILTQCWLAHPELRTPYMILDLQDWDRMPQPLTTNDIFKAVQTQQPTKAREMADVLPWDL